MYFFIFYFTYSFYYLFYTIFIYFTLYFILKKSIFPDFKIVFIFLHITIIIHSLSSSLRYVKKRIKNKYKMNTYTQLRNNYVFLHNSAMLDVGEFCTLLVKMWYIFYYMSINTSALTM